MEPHSVYVCQLKLYTHCIIIYPRLWRKRLIIIYNVSFILLSIFHKKTSKFQFIYWNKIFFLVNNKNNIIYNGTEKKLSKTKLKRKKHKNPLNKNNQNIRIIVFQRAYFYFFRAYILISIVYIVFKHLYAKFYYYFINTQLRFFYDRVKLLFKHDHKKQN